MGLFDQLAAPFPPDRISWRVGKVTKDGKKAMALAYLDARDVMKRLDEVMGPANWQRRYTHADKKTICEIGIKFDGDWIWKADGAGDSDIEAEKGAISDAFKRAAVNFGIGRYLYDVESPWVEINEYKQIVQSEYARLAKILPAPVYISPEDRERDNANHEKADKAVIRMTEVLMPLDTFQRAEWISKNPDAVSILQWIKRNYPAKYKLIEEMGVEV